VFSYGKLISNQTGGVSTSPSFKKLKTKNKMARTLDPESKIGIIKKLRIDEAVGSSKQPKKNPRTQRQEI
jgi:hypothetical protein